MAVTSYKAAGTGANATGVGTVAWTTTSNIVSSNNSYAEAALVTGDTVSNYLKATNFGFTSSDVPSGSTINGIEIRYERQADSSFDNPLATSRLRIVKAGSIHTANVSGMNTANWAATDETITQGGATNLWGQTFTQANIVDSTFGIALSVTMTDEVGLNTAQVDYVEMRIHYTPAASAIPVFMNHYRQQGMA